MREVLPPGQEVFFIFIFLALLYLAKRTEKDTMDYSPPCRCLTFSQRRREVEDSAVCGSRNLPDLWARAPQPQPSAASAASPLVARTFISDAAGLSSRTGGGSGSLPPSPALLCPRPALGRSDFETLETSRTGSLPSNSRVTEASSGFSRRGKREISSHSVLCFFCLLSYKQIVHSK